MVNFYHGIGRALLVEGNDMMRSVAAGQLREAGAEEVVAVSRISAARERLEREHFDLVMCSREFKGKEESGQDLLDELRRENLLAPDTVFIMVAAGATYQDVAEAGEASIDTFLVRPYTTATLTERLGEAIKRRRALSPIFSAMESGDPGAAFMRALMRFQENQPYGLYCGRLAAEMLLRFQRPEDAQKVFERISVRHAKAWARLGVARAQSAAGDLAAARETIERLQQTEPDYADAHELLGQVLIEHGELNAALDHYDSAAELTPGCVTRAQIAATLSFYIGKPGSCVPLLERTCRIGARSRLFNPLTWVLLGFARRDAKDSKAIAAARQGLASWMERHGATDRTGFFLRVLDVLVLQSKLAHGEAAALTRELSLLADQDEFDLEAANVLLSLWARTPAEDWPHAERQGIAQSLGLRLGVTKAVIELMCAAAGEQEAVTAALRQALSSITLYGQRAVQRSMGNDAVGAVAQLLEHAETTRNSKLFELAGLTLKRRASKIANIEELTDRAARGLLRHAKGVSHIAGVQRAGRSAAGVPLRGWNQESSVKALLPALEAVDAALQLRKQRDGAAAPA